MEKKFELFFVSGYNPSSKSGYNILVSSHRNILEDLFPKKVLYFNLAEKQSIEEVNNLYFENKSKSGKIRSVLRRRPSNASFEFEKQLFDSIRKFQPRIIFFEASACGIIAKKIKKIFPEIKIICFFLDIERKRRFDLMKSVPLFYKIDFFFQIISEKIMTRVADYVFVLNQRDFNLYKFFYKKEPNGKLPIILDTEKMNLVFSEEKTKTDEKFKILFVGANYIPNNNSIIWLGENVMPYVNDNVELEIVGFNMEKLKNEFEKYPKIKVIGSVDNLEDFYFSSDAIISPVSEGGGMKVKTAEALLYGKKIIATTESLEGYWEELDDSFRNKHVYLCNTPTEFIETINDISKESFLKNDSELSNWALEHYSLNHAIKEFKDVFFN